MGTSILKDNAGALSDVASRSCWQAGRSALLWTAVAMFAIAWAPETRAASDSAPRSVEAEHPATRNLGSIEAANNGVSKAEPLGQDSDDSSVQLVQATVSDPEQASKRDHNWVETLSCELTNARRDIELLQRFEQERYRAEALEEGLAAARRDVETQAALTEKAVAEAARVKQAGQGSAELLNSLQEARGRSEQLERDLATARHDVEIQTALATTAGAETSRLKAAGDSGVADLQRERERSARLEQELKAARHDVEAQTALAAKAGEEVSRLKGTRESGSTEPQSSLQRERERTAQLEQDLAAARRDIEAQTALAAKTKEEVLQQKRATDAGAAELKQARERADALAQDLSVSRSSVYAYEAQARKAVDEAAELRQAAASSVASVGQATPDERERFARLEQDLAAARRDIEIKTALITKAGEETYRLKAVEKNGAADLQKEHDRSARLEQDLMVARRDIEAKSALLTKAGEETSRLKTAEQSGTADLQKERERSVRLEQDLTAARREVEANNTRVTKAAEETSRLKAVEKSGTADLQKERERSARLEQDLELVRRDLEIQTARAAKASEEAVLQQRTAEAGATELKQSRAKAQAQGLSLSQSAIHAYQAQARKAGNEAAELGQGAANGAPSLREIAQAPDRVERAPGAGSDLGTADSVARDKSIEAAASSVAGRAAPARGAARPNTEQAAETAALVARASSLLRQSDIGAARLVLERAVEMGSAQASFALAETYDPLVLAKWGTYGTRGDARRARELYAKADAEGIQEAKSRLDALRR